MVASVTVMIYLLVYRGHNSFRAGGISRPLSLPTSSLVLLMLWQFLPTSGVSMLARYLATLYVSLPQLDTIGLRVCCFCVSYLMGVLPTLGIPSSTICLRWIHFSSTFLGWWSFCFCLCVGSLLSLVYVFVSPTISVIFSLFSVVFMITVPLPLSAGSMMMELSFLSVCRATRSPLLMLDFGSLARLMVHTTSSVGSS